MDCWNQQLVSLGDWYLKQKVWSSLEGRELVGGIVSQFDVGGRQVLLLEGHLNSLTRLNGLVARIRQVGQAEKKKNRPAYSEPRTVPCPSPSLNPRNRPLLPTSAPNYQFLFNISVIRSILDDIMPNVHTGYKLSIFMGHAWMLFLYIFLFICVWPAQDLQMLLYCYSLHDITLIATTTYYVLLYHLSKDSALLTLPYSIMLQIFIKYLYFPIHNKLKNIITKL